MEIFAKEESQKQLIVLLPGSLAGNLKISKKIHWLAVQDKYKVLYLTIVESLEKKLTTDRSMVTMKAFTSNNVLRVDSLVILSNEWEMILERAYQPGDMIVCQAEQSVYKTFLHGLPIGKYVEEELNLPVTFLSGFYNPQNEIIKKIIKNLIFWAGSISIIVLFFFFSVDASQGNNLVIKSLAGILMMILELCAIWVWTRLFSRY